MELSELLKFPAKLETHDAQVKFHVSTRKKPQTDVCYRTILNSKKNLSVELLPKVKSKSYLGMKCYKKWIKLCIENGLVDKSVKPYTEKGKNCMSLEKGKMDSVCFYTSLCCYRFAENFPSIPFLTIKILEEKEIHFFQSLFYVLTKRMNRMGHSFCEVGIEPIHYRS